MSGYVLDASAVLALLKEEPGAERVLEVLGDTCMISTVNYSEVVARLVAERMPPDVAASRLQILAAGVVDFERGHAVTTGALWTATQPRGLSLGDRACLALAMEYDATAVTADRAWSDLDLGVRVEVIR